MSARSRASRSWPLDSDASSSLACAFLGDFFSWIFRIRSHGSTAVRF